MDWQGLVFVVILPFFIENGVMVELKESPKSDGSVEPSTRIIGGTDVESISDHNYMAYIKTIRENLICGAAIVTRTHLLSAATCLEIYVKPPYLNERVVTGTNTLKGGGEEHMILFTAIHPKYYDEWPQAVRYDYGVITLCAPMIFSRTQGPINLPSGPVRDGDEAVLTGWGTTKYKKDARKSFILQKLVTKVYTAPTCTRMENVSPFNDTVRICTISPKGKGFCDYDTGSPLVVKGELVGLASLRHECASGLKDMYAYVYRALDFIRAEIDEDVCR